MLVVKNVSCLACPAQCRCWREVAGYANLAGFSHWRTPGQTRRVFGHKFLCCKRRSGLPPGWSNLERAANLAHASVLAFRRLRRWPTERLPWQRNSPYCP